MRTFAIHFTKKDEAGEIKFDFGEMAEWSNAAVLKTVDLNGSGGSNPSLSAEKWLTGICKPLFLFNIPKNIPFFEFRSQEDPDHGKNGFVPLSDKTELKNIQFFRKYLPFPGQNVLSFAIVLTLIMKIQSHNQGEI